MYIYVVYFCYLVHTLIYNITSSTHSYNTHTYIQHSLTHPYTHSHTPLSCTHSSTLSYSLIHSLIHIQYTLSFTHSSLIHTLKLSLIHTHNTLSHTHTHNTLSYTHLCVPISNRKFNFKMGSGQID